MSRQKDRQTNSVNTIEPEAADKADDIEKEAPQESQQATIKTQQLRRVRDQLRRVTHTYWSKRRLAIPVSILGVIIVAGAVPLSRYALLGLVIKQDLTVTVIDSQTNAPVSKAKVTIGGKSVATSAVGEASLHSSIGYQTLTITKQYYRTYTDSQLIALAESRNHVTIKLVALGRLVQVKVTNKLTGKPIAGATIKVLHSEAVTGSDGTTSVVVPVTATQQQATISANGFNTVSGNLLVTNQAVSDNSFAITPEGKLYFLSNLSGKIDVVKANLDGTNRQTVLAGTGYENQYNTVILASRDWKYLAFYVQRKATGNPEIDLIDTSTDTMSNIDEGNASFTLVGWDGDRFIYKVYRNGLYDWQSGREALKSFDASTKSITLLAQTIVTGNPGVGYAFQRLGNVYVIESKVLYTLNWSVSFNGVWYSTARQATLNSINPDGGNLTVIKGFNVPSGVQGNDYSIYSQPYDGPTTLMLNVTGDAKYYEYQGGKVSLAHDANAQTFYASYPTYLLSPSGTKTFWSVYADGKNNLLVGDQGGQNPKTVASESDYGPYGWFTDGYLLLQKSGSELYIMAADGTSKPFKITNYYKPQVNYPGYGGGYGGL